MLRIQAITFNSRPLASPVATEFDERGGTIGRAADSTLMLHDEKQYISRTHAMISFSGGSYVLRDLGSATPTFVNGAPVGKGNEIALRDGDEIRIGDYVFSVTEQPVAGPIPEDPFADLLPPSAPAGAPSQPSPPPPIGQLDSMEDPFAVHQRRSAAPSASATSGGIPDDFDPFAETTSPSQAAPAQQLPDDELGLGGSTQPSVDSIFGLRAGESWDPLAPGNPLAAPQGGLDATSNDPFAGLGAPTPPVSPRSAQPDHASMLSGAFRPPQAKFEQPAQAAMPSQPAPQAPKQPAAPHANDMVVSWDTRTSAGAVIKTAIVSAPKRSPQGARDAQAAPSAPATTAAPRVVPEQAPGTAPA
ncbi:MAG: FHA domain-containing protein, partial [Burkholderiales bacterium]